MRTSTAASHGYVCPRCHDRLNRDRSGKGFVSHATNPNCDLEAGERDDFRIWRPVRNDDNGSLITGDVKLPEGAVIRIRGESKDRTVTYVMGSDRNGWRACSSGQGAMPTGDIEWQIISFGPTDHEAPKNSPPVPPPQPPQSPRQGKWFDFHTVKGIVELTAALLGIVGTIGGFIAWLFFNKK